jgi:two-component sensor histidine kinase
MSQAVVVPFAGSPIDASAGLPGCGLGCALRHETDHRVTNHLAMLSSYVRLKSAEFEQPGAPGRDALRLFAQGIDAQIRSIARLHRILTLDNQDADVDLATLLREVCAPFASGLDQRIVLLQDFAPDCCARPDQILKISQIVGEAITNAVKHAYPDGGAGVLLIRSQPTPSGGVLVEVSDNGVGLPDAFDPDRDGGVGFQLMRGLSRGLGAPLVFRSGPQGLRVSLMLGNEG